MHHPANDTHDALPAELAALADQPAPHVDLGPTVRAELAWLASDEFWTLLQAQLARITAEVWGVTSDDGQ